LLPGIAQVGLGWDEIRTAANLSRDALEQLGAAPILVEWLLPRMESRVGPRQRAKNYQRSQHHREGYANAGMKHIE